MRIFIVGPMASGKSTLGKKLAQALSIDFVDTDREIEKKAGAEISWIFEVEGEEGFRERERKVLKKSINKDDVVISTGGGIVTVKENRALMIDKGKVVYLKTPLEIQLKRTEKDKKRPLLAKGNKKQILETLKKERDPKYEEIADITIDQDGQKNRTTIINEIIDRL
ncbi:MAG: shikimate kinase AroK [SAR86 cluster bacterium]|nr:shikimate kinase AroK [SAR86 cluster bacterium]